MFILQLAGELYKAGGRSRNVPPNPGTLPDDTLEGQSVLE
ncbi:hypothetical protein LptCag_2300 [Leptospirillum ferriphilum]|uniref:Uncharacterized protein n=1 Tax=Leptospirillum ferriphilum TaxID=178606 RepID=A0A094YNP2_9BACT|nr:hypothetical protein LptCag_2300 [Leptospirillum ferriphilum]